MQTTPSSRLAARLLVAGAALGLSAASGAANAAQPPTFTMFTSEAAFEAAAPGLETYHFPAGSNKEEARPYVVGPLGFSSLQHFTHPYLEDDGAYGAGKTYLALTGVPGVNAAMQPQGVNLYAVGFDLGTYDGADTITAKLDFYDTLGTFKTTGGKGTSTFIGFISSEPISQVSFTARNGTQIDVLDFQAIPTVPEPASMSLVMAGLGFMGVVARRRKAARA